MYHHAPGALYCPAPSIVQINLRKRRRRRRKKKKKIMMLWDVRVSLSPPSQLDVGTVEACKSRGRSKMQDACGRGYTLVCFLVHLRLHLIYTSTFSSE